ncbi:hypothetical protein [Herbiconiux daphne]|uniref:Uncharacterized protein n=1 Tax=Herbiconiux daphne TaxID=2970914 RepID=A0ABT2H9B8_9MICO|nr:hypothetical protein [Herbiconiux daphne]MCS5736536.1 hypothetical protein [Herbiconiux daphne]
MEIIYENGYYKVVANPYAHIYYIVNTRTEQVEGEEAAEPTAKYKADALKSVTIKFNEKRGEEDAAK